METYDDDETPQQDTQPKHPNRYRTLPVVFMVLADGSVGPAPFLMSRDELAGFFRLSMSKTRFPSKTISRYRKMGLRASRIGRRTWFRLDDVLRFMDEHQDRLEEERTWR